MVAEQSTKDEEQSTSSNQFQPTKEIRNFDGGILVRIGSVCGVFADRSAEFFSNRSGVGFSDRWPIKSRQARPRRRSQTGDAGSLDMNSVKAACALEPFGLGRDW